MLNNVICKRLLDESYKFKRKLKIHSTFNHCINLTDENGSLITILDKTKAMMPYSIMFINLPMISVKEKIILFNGRLFLNGQEQIKLQKFKVYDSSVENLYLSINWQRIQKRFNELALFLKNCTNREGMLPFVMNEELNEFNKPIYDDYVAWLNSYKSKVGFDVFNSEPLDLCDSLFEIDPSKLILTSHMAGFSNERSFHQYEIGYNNLISFLKGKAVLNNCTKNVEESEFYVDKGKKLFGIMA